MSKRRPKPHHNQEAHAASEEESRSAHDHRIKPAAGKRQSAPAMLLAPPPASQETLLPLMREVQRVTAAYSIAYAADPDSQEATDLSNRMLELRLAVACSLPGTALDALVMIANAMRAIHVLTWCDPAEYEKMAVNGLAGEAWIGLDNVRQYLEQQAQITVDCLGLPTVSGPTAGLN